MLGASLACFGIGVFVLPAGIVVAGFAKEVREDITPEQLSDNHAQESVASSKTHLYQEILSDAKLLKYCLHAAQEEMGSIESDKDAIDSWAMFLYVQAKQENFDRSDLVNKP